MFDITLPPDTLISIDGETPITVTAFYADNDFTPDEIEAFEAGMRFHGEQIFGGRAGEEFVVRLVPDSAPDPDRLRDDRGERRRLTKECPDVE